MSYTPDSSFLSRPIGTAAQWAAAIRPHNPADADALAAAYFRNGDMAGINADLALAQAAHETAWFSSDRWTRQHNPCGLGITAPDTPGVDFRSVERGVLAHLLHLCCYVYAADPPALEPFAALDPRHTFHDARPRVCDLVRPDRRWADPGDGYAAAIVRIANDTAALVITPEGDSTMTAYPTAADLGFPVRIHLAADTGPRRALADIAWFIVHDTEGNPAGDEAILTSANPPVESAHALILPDGETVFMVPLEETAWTPGNDPVAVCSVNVELSGFAADGYTDAQYTSLARFFRWCVSRGMTDVPAVYAARTGDPGIIGHQDVPNPYHKGAWGGAAGHTDPGAHFDWHRLVAAIADAATAPPAVPPTPLAFYVGNNPYGAVPVRPPFWNRWHYLDDLGLALPTMGYPIEPERTGANGRRIQRFERGWYATQPAADPWDVVALPPAEYPAA